MANLQGKRVAVLVTSGVEEVELTRPVEYLCAHGAGVTIISPKREEITDGMTTKSHGCCGDKQKADILIAEAKPEEFDALYIPGGLSPDHLRMAPGAVDFVRAFKDKLIIAICHGPQLLVSADLVRGRTITSWPSLEIDLKNAGAHWVNEPVVVDGNLITARMPDDIPALNEKINDALRHLEQYRRAA